MYVRPYIRKKADLIIYSLPALLLCLPYVVPPATMPHLAMLFVQTYSLAGAAGGLFPSLRKTALLCMLTALSCFAISLSAQLNAFSTGVDSARISTVECVATGDSSLSRSGRCVFQARLVSCTSQNGTKATARGLVTVICKDCDRIITCGERLLLYGAFSEGFFTAEETKVTRKGWLCTLRENLILALEKRIAGNTRAGEDAQMLSLMLIMGRAEDEQLYVRNLATKCGCTHVLALSGMHLGVITALFKALGKKRKMRIPAKVGGILTVAAFVFVAGPRPSLLRAAIMFFLGFLEVRQRLALSFVIQSLAYPAGVLGLGNVYSYLATTAMVNEKRGFLGTTIAVLAFTVPVQLLTDGSWSPAVIIAQLPAALLAEASMILGFLILVFGRLPFLLVANGWVCLAMERLFEKCSVLPKLGLEGYLALLALPLATALLKAVMLSYAGKKCILQP